MRVAAAFTPVSAWGRVTAELLPAAILRDIARLTRKAGTMRVVGTSVKEN